MTKEALTLALESLEWHNQHMHRKISEQAITAIKEALMSVPDGAQPEQDWIERERAVGYREGHQNALKQMAQPSVSVEQEPKCNPHPKAPHGFNRNASHSNDRYTCECEGWDAYEAGYQDGLQKVFEIEPEQEPVAWRAPNWGHGDDEWVYRDFDDPVLIADGKPSPNNEALYTTPPQRKPLTDEEIGAILEGVNAYGTRLYTFARAIEAAHGIKV